MHGNEYENARRDDDPHDDKQPDPQKNAVVLLPCPFCGSEADYFSDPHDHGTDHIVDCRECYCRITCGRKEAVIENWNKRDGVPAKNSELMSFQDSMARYQAANHGQ